MPYSQVNPQINKADINPADRNNMAIQAGYTGYEDYLNNRGSTQPGVSSGQAASPAQQVAAPDFNAILQKAQAAQREASQGAISSFQASIPETQARFDERESQLEAEKAPLQQRYKLLLDKINARETTQTQEAQLRTQNELGRRGLSLESGASQQEIAKAVDPIRQQYGELETETTIARESDLRAIGNQIANLGGQETEALRTINNAMAQLQYSSGSDAISNALSQLNIQQGAFQFGQQLAQQSSQFAQTLGISKQQLQMEQQSNDMARQQLESLLATQKQERDIAGEQRGLNLQYLQAQIGKLTTNAGTEVDTNTWLQNQINAGNKATSQASTWQSLSNS